MKNSPKEIAINFLVSLSDDSTENEAVANLLRDAKAYRWNAVTITAIAAGIVAFKHEGKKGVAEYVTSLED